jgi:hypothetical protein
MFEIPRFSNLSLFVCHCARRHGVRRFDTLGHPRGTNAVQRASAVLVFAERFARPFE